jgi:GntR family transcriptional regulator
VIRGGLPTAANGAARSRRPSASTYQQPPRPFCVSLRLGASAVIVKRRGCPPETGLDGRRKVYQYAHTLELFWTAALLLMDIAINLTDGVPIYRQIVNQVKYLVASGLLRPGEELPPIRTLALQLKVTPNTIVKAYGELEISGIVHKRQGSGTYVSEGRPKLALLHRRRIIEQRIDALLAEAHQLNFSADDILRMIRERKVAMDAATTAEPADVEN